MIFEDNRLLVKDKDLVRVMLVIIINNIGFIVRMCVVNYVSVIVEIFSKVY